jgi:hypothetical protein
VIGENLRGASMYELLRVGHNELVGGELGDAFGVASSWGGES